MRVLRCFMMAFSMYSILPMPQVEWNEKNQKYALCCFPAVGVVIGGCILFWNWLSAIWGVGELLRSVVFTCIPIFISGGIHLDGFCDTADALASHLPPERKLAILKDSHAGAFAIIALCVYLLLTFGLWSEVSRDTRMLGMIAVGFVMSRVLSGMSVILFRCAKTSGLAATFAQSADRKRCGVIFAFLILFCAAAMLRLHPVAGGLALLFLGCLLFYYRMTSYRKFGGVTGDLAGYFLQLGEAGILLAAVIAGKLTG